MQHEIARLENLPQTQVTDSHALHMQDINDFKIAHALEQGKLQGNI